MSQDGAGPPIPVLLIRGPSGVGKTTVAHEISALLRERSLAHALVDTDDLVRIVPVPAADARAARLAALNLSALWANYRAAGARRLILVGVIESLASDVAWIRESVPAAQLYVVRLRASRDALHERLSRRHSTPSFDEHLCTSIAVGTRMDREAAGAGAVVETTGRPVGDVARDILRCSGWA